MSTTAINLTARYPSLNLTQLEHLTDTGIACLELTPGYRPGNARVLFDEAQQRFRDRSDPSVNVKNYRGRLHMILNSCRDKVTRAWEHSPTVKPMVTNFLQKCREYED